MQIFKDCGDGCRESVAKRRECVFVEELNVAAGPRLQSRKWRYEGKERPSQEYVLECGHGDTKEKLKRELTRCRALFTPYPSLH